MREATCNTFGTAMREEWATISTGRWARARFKRWVEVEPLLGELGSMEGTVSAIAVPLGHSADLSVEVTDAVLRLAVEDPLAVRLVLHVMVPILAKESFKSLRLLQAQNVRVPDAEVVTMVLGAATDAIASIAGTEKAFPLRTLRDRTIRRIRRRRDRIVRDARELVIEELPEVAASPSAKPAAVLLAETLRLAVGKGIVTEEDAHLVWASTHHGETSMSLAGGNKTEAERLRRRRSRAQRRMADHRGELVEVMAV